MNITMTEDETRKLLKSLEEDLVAGITYTEVDDLDTSDYPDVYGWISYAEYKGIPLSEKELELVNDQGVFVYETVWNKLH